MRNWNCPKKKNWIESCYKLWYHVIEQRLLEESGRRTGHHATSACIIIIVV